MVSPEAVKEALVSCFISAHKEFMANEMRSQDQAVDEAKLREQTLGIIKNAFEKTGGNYDNPTKLDFTNAMTLLVQEARAAGRDPAIINRHASSLLQLITEMDE